MFNTHISLYGTFLIIAIILGLFVVYLNSKRFDFNKDEIYALIVYIVIGTIFGAKYFTFFSNPQKYDWTFNFATMGLSSYGSLLGIIVVVFIFSKQFKRPLKDMFYIILPAIPLIYGVGKIGCFLAGCCYGFEYSGPLSITYNYSLDAPNGVSLFPVQILETIVFIFIFIYLFITVKKDKTNKNLIGKTFIMCGLAKFLLDYFRVNHTGQVISINQVVSIIFILIGIFLIYKNRISKTEI